MKKKTIILTMIVVAVVGLGVYGANKLGVFYQKKTEPALEIPKWRETIIITNESYVPYKDEYDIIKNTDQLGGAAEKYYSKYIDYIAPNGKPIHILAQNEVTDEQLLYAYSILSFYLHNLGDHVANQIAENEAVLIMPNGADRDGKTPMLAMFGQNQNQEETANVGSKWYIDNDYEHRDAAFEEIFHLVHDNGIGTTQNPQADKALSEKISKATFNALGAKREDWGKNGLWALDFGSSIEEWEEEGSLEQEYIVSVIDSYYGLWEAWTEGNGGMWGGYIAKTRDEIKEKDPMGYETLTSFLPPYINTFMRADPYFEGRFEMVRNEENPYTFKSQYLQNLILTGSNDVSVLGNDADNIFMGNSGTNEIDGGLGENVLQLRGAFAEYKVQTQDDFIVITDSISGRDGICKIKNIGTLRFIDEDISIGNIE